MVLRERISANEKREVLSTLSPNIILVISGFLGGVIVALLLSPLTIKGVPWLHGGIAEESLKGIVIEFLVVLGLLGAVAAKLLQWEYRINREAYKRGGEFHVPLVYPFFFLFIMGIAIIQWLKSSPGMSSSPTVWVAVLILALGSAVLSPTLGVIWRFWYILWLSLLSPVDWRAIAETQSFNRQLKISFAGIKRYSSPLSLTIMDINQSAQLRGRVVKKIQGDLINIIEKNIREADLVGRIEKGKVVVTMAHTGSGGASIQAKRIKKILEEHLKSLETKGKVTLSIGIASYAPDMTSHDDLLKKAQLALHRAKEEGGDQVCVV